MIKENDWGMYRDPKLPEPVVKILGVWEYIYKGIPVLGLLWSIGFYTWLLFVLIGAAVRKEKSILPFLPMVAILISLFIATPVQAEFRYSYAMVTAMPLFIAIVCEKKMRREYAEDSSIDTML